MALSLLGSISRVRGYGGVSSLIHRSLSSLSSLLRSQTLPVLMLQPITEERGDVVCEFFSLAENRALSFKSCSVSHPKHTLVGPSQGWLGLYNLLQHRMGLMSPPSSDKDPDPFTFKVRISCSPDSNECRVLLAYGDYSNILSFCCPGRSDNTWTQIRGNVRYGSCVYSRRQKLFFCTRTDLDDYLMECYGPPCREPPRHEPLEGAVYLEAWDLRDPLSPKMIQMTPNLDDSPRSWGGYSQDFLVINDDTDDLFLVRRFINNDPDDLSHVSRPYKTITFDVHRYDPQSKSFRYMDPRGGSSLDGLSFFIDENNGFVLSAKEFPGLKPNSIYFIVSCHQAWDDTNFGGYDLGIFNYQDATISPCYYPSDPHRFRTMTLREPWWFIPNTATTTKTN